MELIVVLVIMAILVAALVPSLVGYIRQARQSNSKDEASSVVQAAQTITSSAFANASMTYENQSGSDITFTDFDTFPTAGTSVVKELAEVDGTIDSIVIDDAVVVYVQYKADNGDYVTYDSNASTKYSVGTSYNAQTSTSST